MSRITVVTVVKNGAGLLEETVLSVVEKKGETDLDYIVVDGGSTDGTIGIIKKYSDQITCFISEHDNGIYDAMNKGWAAADDDSFILYLGAGDRIVSLPETMTGYHRHDVVYGRVQMGDCALFTPRADYHLKLYNSLHHQALLVHKALHPAPPFDCRYPTYADFDFNQRLKKSGARFVPAPDFIGYARTGGVSDRGSFAESLSVITANFGFLWAAVAFSGYYAMKLVPCLKRLRPIRQNEAEGDHGQRRKGTAGAAHRT